jgi:hypothetical protein
VDNDCHERRQRLSDRAGHRIGTTAFAHGRGSCDPRWGNARHAGHNRCCFSSGRYAGEIARNYDALSLGEVYQAIGYYLAHQAEVEAYLDGGRASRAALQNEVEAQHNPNGILQRLLARRKHAA